MENFDAIVIGGGAAGLTASLYLGRYQRKTALITKDFFGLASIAGIIENFPGIPEIQGYELLAKMKEQATSNENVSVRDGEEVVSISKEGSHFKLKTNKSEYSANSVIIAAGTSHRTLGVENEEKLVGRGVSYCATCDGTLARDKEAIIAGGGYAGTEAALIVAKLAAKLTIINIGSELSGETVTIDKVKATDKIAVINDSQITSLLEEGGKLAGVELKNNKSGELSKLNADMVFVEIGQKPATEDFKGFVELNDRGEIVINHNSAQTSVEGVYACGDVSDNFHKQIIVACGYGAKAAMSANKYLEKVS